MYITKVSWKREPCVIKKCLKRHLVICAGDFNWYKKVSFSLVIVIVNIIIIVIDIIAIMILFSLCFVLWIILWRMLWMFDYNCECVYMLYCFMSCQILLTRVIEHFCSMLFSGKSSLQAWQHLKTSHEEQLSVFWQKRSFIWLIRYHTSTILSW